MKTENREPKTETKGAHWYVGKTGNHQGLVIEEGTGRNVAVAYDKQDAPLLAAAPELLEALKEMDRAHAVMCEAIPHGKFPTAKLEAAGVPSGFMSRVHAAIAKATGQN